MANHPNPFEQARKLEPVSLDLGELGEDLPFVWLSHGAVTAINQRLVQYGVDPKQLEVGKVQGGQRYPAIGAPLRKLQDQVNERQRSLDRPEMDRVAFALGLDLTGTEDFHLGAGRDIPFYMGIRIQSTKPYGTVDRQTHKLVYEACIERLRSTSLGGWKEREGSWSVWRYCSTEPDLSAAKGRETIVDEFLNGLACLRGLCWDD